MTGRGVVLVVGDANPDLVLRGDTAPRRHQADQLLALAGTQLDELIEV